jgi:hypothetical protein
MRKRKSQTTPSAASGTVFSSNVTAPALSVAAPGSNTAQEQRTQSPPGFTDLPASLEAQPEEDRIVAVTKLVLKLMKQNVFIQTPCTAD